MLTLRAVPLLAAVAAPRAAIAIDQEDTFEAEVVSMNVFSNFLEYIRHFSTKSAQSFSFTPHYHPQANNLHHN